MNLGFCAHSVVLKRIVQNSSIFKKILKCLLFIQWKSKSSSVVLDPTDFSLDKTSFVLEIDVTRMSK